MTNRHHPVETIRSYLNGVAPGSLQLSGSPDATVNIEPLTGSIGFRVPAGGHEPELSSYRWIACESILMSDAQFDVLTIKVPGGALEETYAWMCTVIDRIQLEGQSLRDAIDQSLAALDTMLAQQRGLSIEQQIGLFGELMLLTIFAKCSRQPKPCLRGSDLPAKNMTSASQESISK